MAAQPPTCERAKRAPRREAPCGGSWRAPADEHQPLSISLPSARSARVRTSLVWIMKWWNEANFGSSISRDAKLGVLIDQLNCTNPTSLRSTPMIHARFFENIDQMSSARRSKNSVLSKLEEKRRKKITRFVLWTSLESRLKELETKVEVVLRIELQAKSMTEKLVRKKVEEHKQKEIVKR